MEAMRRPALPKKPLWKIAIPFLLLAAAGAAFFTLGGPDTVDTVHPRRGQAIQAVYATGTVEPSVMIPISPRTGARLVELLTDEGRQVEKGAVLGRLEDKDLQETLEEAEIQTIQAQKEYESRSALGSTGAVAREDIDRARTTWQTAKAAMERARAELDYMKLIAPNSGTIIRRDGEIGELIPANHPVFWMTCCEGLRVSAEVDEEDIALVKTGQKVAIHADAFPDRTFDGTVSSITPKGDPVARSYRVRIGLDRDTPLMIGMTAETNIIIRTADDALLIPASAVQDGKVWTLRGGVLKRQAVETGARSSSAVEILQGLDDKDTIVRDPAEGLEEGGRARSRLRDWKPG